jgi:thiol-disulfide isomerase/thioredoxin
MLTPRPIYAAMAAIALLTGAARAADLPRKAPELSINMPGGNPVLLSQYRGRVVAMCFILTTCPHCQKTIGYLVKLQNEYGPKGFQVLASAIENGAALAVPNFVKTFQTPFPVGFNDPQTAVDFMQHPPMLVPLMPMLSFVDRQGMIRDQHEGNDEAFFGAQQEENLRKQIESLLGAGQEGRGQENGRTQVRPG